MRYETPFLVDWGSVVAYGRASTRPCEFLGHWYCNSERDFTLPRAQERDGGNIESAADGDYLILDTK